MSQEMKTFSVLVVDDEEEFRTTTIKQLHRKGLTVEGAENGKAALAKMDNTLFDVVLLDVKMPEMNGIETLRNIKKMQPLVEVVLLTGHASVDSGIEGMKLGAFDYLMKPMDSAELLATLADAYEKRYHQLERIERAQMKKHMSMPC